MPESLPRDTWACSGPGRCNLVGGTGTGPDQRQTRAAGLGHRQCQVGLAEEKKASIQDLKLDASNDILESEFHSFCCGTYGLIQP